MYCVPIDSRLDALSFTSPELGMNPPNQAGNVPSHVATRGRY